MGECRAVHVFTPATLTPVRSHNPRVRRSPHTDLTPTQRRYLEHLAGRLTRHAVLDQRTECLLPAEPAERDDTLARIMAAPPELVPAGSFRVAPAVARLLTATPLPHRTSPAAPAGAVGTFLGVPVRVDPAMPPDRIGVEHPDGSREYVKVTPPNRRFSTYITAPAGASRWRRFLTRCRSWRRARRP